VEDPEDSCEIDLPPDSGGDDKVGNGDGKVDGGAGLKGLS